MKTLEIKTKFDVNDKCYFIYDDKIYEGFIQSVYIKKSIDSTIIRYDVVGNSGEPAYSAIAEKKNSKKSIEDFNIIK